MIETRNLMDYTLFTKWHKDEAKRAIARQSTFSDAFHHVEKALKNCKTATQAKNILALLVDDKDSDIHYIAHLYYQTLTMDALYDVIKDKDVPIYLDKRSSKYGKHYYRVYAVNSVGMISDLTWAISVALGLKWRYQDAAFEWSSYSDAEGLTRRIGELLYNDAHGINYMGKL